MKQLDTNDLKLCQIQAEIFERSLDISNFSSPMFIRRFMMDESMTKAFDNKSYLVLSNAKEDLLYELNDKYKPTNKNPQYSKDAMYWIGYIYRALCILYGFSSRQIYKMFPGPTIVEYFPIYHTFGIEQAAERMLESIGIEYRDLTEEGIKFMKRMMYLEQLFEYMDKDVSVIVDNPMGSKNSEYETTNYPINCGHIESIKVPSGDYQDAYILGVDKPLKSFDGKVIAIVNRKDDEEDRLVVAPIDKQFTTKEINSMINFKEKYYKHKIIRN